MGFWTGLGRLFRRQETTMEPIGNPLESIGNNNGPTMAPMETREEERKNSEGMAFLVGNRIGDIDGRLQHVEKEVEKLDSILERLAKLETRPTMTPMEPIGNPLEPIGNNNGPTMAPMELLTPKQREILGKIKSGTSPDDVTGLSQSTGCQLSTTREHVRQLRKMGLI